MNNETISNPEPPAAQEQGAGRRWVWAVVLMLIAGGGWYAWSKSRDEKQVGNARQNASGRRGPGAPSVIAVRATQGDIGVYLTGLGSVTAINTVTVRSRVEGELVKVHYTEGQFVQKGDPLVDIDPRPYQVQLSQLEAQLLKDNAVLENARLDLARYEELIPKKAVPEQTVATQKATVAQNEATIRSDQAQMENVKLNLAYCHITAALSGRLGLRLVDPGNYVQSGSATALAVITQMDPISVIFTLSEDQLSPVLKVIRSGRKLRVDAYDRELNQKLAQGVLSTVDNQIDQTTGTVKLRAVFDNGRNALFPNQFVNAKMLVEEKHRVTLLPTDAVQRNSQATYVYLVNPNKTVSIRNVTLGTTDGANTEITSGLKPGDVVASSGVDKLQEGAQVEAHIEGEPNGGAKQ